MGSEEKQKHDLRRTQNLINRCLSHRLPFLCARSSSLNDVPLNSKWLHHHQHTSSTDPLSPTVSCIGQVKRSNRVVGFPAAHRPFSSPNTVNSNSFSNHRPRRFFSPRNLICTSAPIAAANGGTGRRRLEGRGCCKPKKLCPGGGTGRSSWASAMDNIVDLDPPLPVPPPPPTKQSGSGGEAAVSLWKRRSRGAALKSLQLQQIGQPSLDSAQLPSVM